MTRIASTHAATLVAAVRRLARTSVLVVGDVMLDRYIYGRVERISPEAPVPILSIEREVALPGGAGNVVRNLTALGAAVAFVSVVGDDQAGSDLTGLVGGQPGVEPWLLVQGARTTTLKTRYVAAGQQLLRADQETTDPIHPKLADRLLRITRDALAATSVCVLSDYAKGLLADDIPRRIIADAKAAGRRVIVDPKGADYARYTGADIITPNRRELAVVTGLPVATAEEIVAAARLLQERFAFGAVLVTQSEDGMTLVTRDEVHHLLAEAPDVVDAAGAGDTVIATLAAGLAAKMDLPMAARLANIAAGIVVGRAGTAVAREGDLLAALSSDALARRKVVGRKAAAEQVERWRHRGWRTGFVQGSFDAEQPAHHHLIEQARAHCDRLVVGLPPIEGHPDGVEHAQAAQLAGLAEVDLIVRLDTASPEALLRLLRPDVMFSDGNEPPGRFLDELVQSWDGVSVPVHVPVHGMQDTPDGLPPPVSAAVK